MIRVERTQAGRCTAYVQCDYCGASALPPVAFDPENMVRESVHLKYAVVWVRGWIRLNTNEIICYRCWKEMVHEALGFGP
jgi:DNA-directed RNA polymerase subunit RPC12/RpoP